MVRNFFRLLILGFGAFLLYFWITHKLEWIALLCIYLVLFLFFLATFVTTLEQNNERSSGDGIPTNLEEFQATVSNSNVLIRTDSEGRNILFPLGILGNGYVLHDSSKEEEIKKFLFAYSGINTVLFVIVLMFVKESVQFTILLLVLTPITILWYRIKMAKFLRGLEIIKKGTAQYAPSPINKRGGRFLIAMMVLGIIGGIGNIYNKGFTINDFLLAIGSAVFLILFFNILWIRK